MFIYDPKRTLSNIDAAAIWLGFNPYNDEIYGVPKNDLMSYAEYLSDAAKRGELDYYDKKVVKTVDQLGLDEPIKIYQYTFTLQSLIDFARIKKHHLKILDTCSSIESGKVVGESGAPTAKGEQSIIDSPHSKLQIANDRIAKPGNKLSPLHDPAENKLGLRAETTYLNIIAALLDCIAGNLPEVDKHPSFESEAKLIEAIAKNYEGCDGLSKRNLERKFPAAKKSMQTQ